MLESAKQPWQQKSRRNWGSNGKNRVSYLFFLRGQTNWGELRVRARDITNLGDILIFLLEDGGAEFPLRRIDHFTRIMQLGYFAFIFDGFDELTKSSEDAPLFPQENFDWLASISKDSNTRIMLTTRSSFWEREIVVSTATKHKLYHLNPFDSDSVFTYFKQYFSGKKNGDFFTQEAKSYYRRKLRQFQGNNGDGGSFLNLPASAMMIADHVEKGGDDDDDDSAIMKKSTPQYPSRQFFEQILERENIRQETETNTEAMHEVFENIAITSIEFELDDIATDPRCEIEPEDIDKISDHAFLKMSANYPHKPRKFFFKNDSLFQYLQASYILRFIMGKQRQSFQDEYKENKGLRALIEVEADGSGYLIERVAHVLDMRDIGKVIDLHKACIGRNLDLLKSFLFHIIAKTVISRRHGESRREQGDIILSLLGDGDIKCVENLHVRGVLGEIYISDWKILNSSFVDFSLAKGNTHGNLRFVNCEFFGNLVLPDGSQCEKCMGDGAAKLILNQIGSAEITEEDIRKDLKVVLGRFWFQGRFHARTISEDNWKTGRTKIIDESYNLLEILRRENVIENHQHYPRLQIKKDAIYDVKEFMENGMVQRRVRSVLKRMESELHRSR